MDQQKLEYFRNLLLEQRRQATEDVETERAAGLSGDDGVEDIGDQSESDLERSTAFELASRESQLIEDIDEALRRIDEGTYGQCRRCGKPIAGTARRRQGLSDSERSASIRRREAKVFNGRAPVNHVLSGPLPNA